MKSSCRSFTVVLLAAIIASGCVKNGKPPALHFSFNTELSSMIYAVESPDAIGPAGGSKTVLRYCENLFSAATAYKERYGVIAFGFPFETILDFRARNTVMRGVLNYFGI